MYINPLEQWQGKPVVAWTPGMAIEDPTGSAYKLWIEYESGVEWPDLFAQFLETPRSGEITSLVLGAWHEEMFEEPPTNVIEGLSAASDRLPHLTSLFLGAIEREECEISWITQADISPLFLAYPHLEHLGIRGTNELMLGRFSLPALRSLTIESGGMPLSVAEDAIAADLPALEHMELWLGTASYGGEVTTETVMPLLQHPERWPKLTYLGLRDSEIVDDIAEALVDAPILRQLTVLDLSLGTLTDRGAEALARNPLLRSLKKLDVRHNYLGEEMIARLKTLGITVDTDERGYEYKRGDGSVSRFVAVGE